MPIVPAKRNKEESVALVGVVDQLVSNLKRLSFDTPVTHVYNPLVYARDAHLDYLRRYGLGQKEVILLGMNPGPWGMAQTGVPFGEVNLVRDWLGISHKIQKPRPEHPKRPILGFDCPRSEVSGARLWGWARDRFGKPQSFFKRFFIVNYCPLVFMEQSGKNFTPDKLPANQREPLLNICDEALRDMIELFKPKMVIGVGVFAENCAKRALSGMDVSIGRMLHPSPASPAANRDWAGTVSKQLAGYGIKIPKGRANAPSESVTS